MFYRVWAYQTTVALSFSKVSYPYVSQQLSTVKASALILIVITIIGIAAELAIDRRKQL